MVAVDIPPASSRDQIVMTKSKPFQVRVLLLTVMGWVFTVTFLANTVVKIRAHLTSQIYGEGYPMALHY